MKVAEDRPAGSSQSKKKLAKRKIRVPKNALLVRFLLHPAGKTILALIVVALLTGMGIFIHYYNVYSKLIDERLRGGPYSTTARIFAAPGAVAVNELTSPSDL